MSIHDPEDTSDRAGLADPNAASSAPEGGGDAGAVDGESGRDGDKDGSWLKDVPVEHLKTAGRYKSLGDLLNGHAELRAKMDSALFVPGDDATGEERARFLERLGRPREASGYRPPRTDGDGFDEARQTAFFEKAHGIGLTRDQVEALMTWELENARTAREEDRKAHLEAHGRIQEAWGEDAAANYEKAWRVGDILFPGGRREALGLADDPKLWNARFAEALAAVAPSFMDHPHLGKADRDLGGGDAALEAELDELMNRPDYRANEHHQRRAREISEALYGAGGVHPAAD